MKCSFLYCLLLLFYLSINLQSIADDQIKVSDYLYYTYRTSYVPLAIKGRIFLNDSYIYKTLDGENTPITVYQIHTKTTAQQLFSDKMKFSKYNTIENWFNIDFSLPTSTKLKIKFENCYNDFLRILNKNFLSFQIIPRPYLISVR